jgi:hypothetical protein
MTWDTTVKLSDLAIVLATIAGPILAVQAQKWVERWREGAQRKKWVFQTLMTTRATPLATEHVQALNWIVLAFYGRRRWWSLGRTVPTKTETAVMKAWNSYLAQLNIPIPQDEGGAGAWNGTTRALLTNLLVAIAPDVGFEFDRVLFEQGAYHPYAHEVMMSEQNKLRKQTIELLEGKRSLKMDVERFPVNEAATVALTELHSRLNAALDGQRALSVKVERDAPPMGIPVR